MSETQVRAERIYAGLAPADAYGIEMAKHGWLIVCAITLDGLGSIQLHPGFDWSNAKHLIPLVKLLSQEAVAALEAGPPGSSEAH
ncbi:MAG: hypothetical protein OXE46_02930 [Chloroflexi bacterium]|nr:hypothetical protein [Chloroflexota bacterium]